MEAMTDKLLLWRGRVVVRRGGVRMAMAMAMAMARTMGEMWKVRRGLVDQGRGDGRVGGEDVRLLEGGFWEGRRG